MLVVWRERRENQALSRYPARLGLAPQRLARLPRKAKQPEDRRLDLPEQLHPLVKNVWGDLVGLVERTEYQGPVGKPVFRAGARIAHRVPRAVGLIGERHPDDLLGVKSLLAGPDQHFVRHDIVAPGSAQRARIAKPLDLERRRPEPQNLASRALRPSGAVDDDIA